VERRLVGAMGWVVRGGGLALALGWGEELSDLGYMTSKARNRQGAKEKKEASTWIIQQ
jgi:hypothetical protein